MGRQEIFEEVIDTSGFKQHDLGWLLVKDDKEIYIEYSNGSIQFTSDGGFMNESIVDIIRDREHIASVIAFEQYFIPMGIVK